jgi:hypothetical protein
MIACCTTTIRKPVSWFSLLLFQLFTVISFTHQNKKNLPGTNFVDDRKTKKPAPDMDTGFERYQ